jgi:glycosyltransferase involved in cell wall biosynthesis
MKVLVLPSYREGFGLVLAEAAAMSVPVIATNIRGCRTTVVSGSNGLLVPAKDISALYEALDYILSNQERALEMGRLGRLLAEQRFGQQDVFAALKSEYDDLIATML